MKRALLVVAVFGALLASASHRPLYAASAGTGTFTHHTLPAAPDGSYPSRDYWLYVPRTLAPVGQRALVTYLHGCTQSGDDAARGVGWNSLADRRGFVVVYPEQHVPAVGSNDVDGSAAQCWNWGQVFTTTRGQGEIESVAQITRVAAATNSTSPGRSFLVGVSAGAMMANVEAATYPDLYTSFGSVAGCSYMCGDPTGDLAAQRMGARARAMPAFVVTGTADYLTNPAMGELTIAQWLGTNDVVDDGAHNASVSPLPASTENRNMSSLTRARPLHGDACLHDFPRNPCVLGAAGVSPYPATVRTYDDAAGKPILEAWLVHGLSHNYSGGDSGGSFTDPFGPDITTPMWNFFEAHAA